MDGWDFLSEIIEDEQTPKPGVFDVVLVDLALPSISGIQVIHTISTVYPTLPIIIVSASAIEYLESVKLRYPKVKILQKPFKIQDLLTLIQQ
jgi:CheY-like chemotaxis protein